MEMERTHWLDKLQKKELDELEEGSKANIHRDSLEANLKKI